MSKKETGVVHDTIILTIITLAAGAVLGGVHHITAEPIAAQEIAATEAAQKAVFAEAASFEDLGLDESAFTAVLEAAGIDQTSVYSVSEALDASGNMLGYVVDSGNNEGYGGEVEIMVGIGVTDEGMTINGISFLNLEETAGMGMRADEDEFKDQFSGMELDGASEIAYTKTGKSASNEIDAISGCTITTSAVTKAVNGALAAVQSLEEGE